MMLVIPIIGILCIAALVIIIFILRGKRKQAFLLAAITIIGVGILYFLTRNNRTLPSTGGLVRGALQDIAVPAGTEFVRVCTQGCEACKSTAETASFTTDLSPEEVRSFYHEYLQGSGWVSIQEDEFRSESGRADAWMLSASWPFPESDPQKRAFYLESTTGSNPAPHVPSCRTAMEATTFASRKTFFSVVIFYNQDVNLFKGECGSEEFQCDYWYQ